MRHLGGCFNGVRVGSIVFIRDKGFFLSVIKLMGRGAYKDRLIVVRQNCNSPLLNNTSPRVDVRGSH